MNGQKSHPEKPHTEGYQHLSPVQQAVLQLYDAGMNVFPQPFGHKSGYPWKRLQYTRLHRENPANGLLDLFRHSSNAAIMCGFTSGNLFVIDCETQDTFLAHLYAMKARNIPIWAVQTARGGHIYLRSSEGEVHNVIPGELPDAEVRGQNGYVLAPPSLHPSGKLYKWIIREGETPPVVHPDQIDWLKTRAGMRVRLTYDPPRQPERETIPRWTFYEVSSSSNLSGTTRDYLDTGHLIPPGSRNNRLFSAACDFAGNDYSYHEAEYMLLPPALGSGLSEREIQRTLKSAYSQNRQPARPENHQPAPAHWRYALYFASRHQWTGRTRTTDRSVFLALVERARAGSNEQNCFRASVRELAQLARMGTGTVQKALKRLSNPADERAALLVRRGNDRMSGASLWQFSDDVLTQGKELAARLKKNDLPTHLAGYAASLFNADACERGTVGRSSMYLYRYMVEHLHPMMPAALSEAARLTVNQVNYALNRLKENGLVRREADGWVAIPMSDKQLDAHVNAAPRGITRRKRFKKERQLFVGNILLRAILRFERRGLKARDEHQTAYWLKVKLDKKTTHENTDSQLEQSVQDMITHAPFPGERGLPADYVRTDQPDRLLKLDNASVCRTNARTDSPPADLHDPEVQALLQMDLVQCALELGGVITIENVENNNEDQDETVRTIDQRYLAWHPPPDNNAPGTDISPEA